MTTRNGTPSQPYTSGFEAVADAAHQVDSITARYRAGADAIAGVEARERRKADETLATRGDGLGAIGRRADMLIDGQGEALRLLRRIVEQGDRQERLQELHGRQLAGLSSRIGRLEVLRAGDGIRFEGKPGELVAMLGGASEPAPCRHPNVLASRHNGVPQDPFWYCPDCEAQLSVLSVARQHPDVPHVGRRCNQCERPEDDHTDAETEQCQARRLQTEARINEREMWGKAGRPA